MKGNLKHVFQAMFMVLATVMLLSIPASAASSKTVATIGKKSYTSLEAAVKKVKKGQTIKLKKDVKVSSLTLNRNVKYTINLNGHKITRKNVGATIQVKKGNVIIKNGTLGCNVTVYKNASLTTSSVKMQSKYTPSIKVNKKGKLTIKSGTYYQLTNSGTLSITKGTFYRRIINNSTGSVKIKNGTFKPDSESPCIDNSGGTVTISNGTFKNTDCDCNFIRNRNGGKMKISGGTYSMIPSSSDSAPNTAFIWNESGSTMTISGGTFDSKSHCTISNIGTLTISGGTIKNSASSGNYDVDDVVSNLGTFKMTGGSLKATNGSGYALRNQGKATLKGGSLSTNKNGYKVYNNPNASLSYSSSVLSKSQIDD